MVRRQKIRGWKTIKWGGEQKSEEAKEDKDWGQTVGISGFNPEI